MVSGALLHVRGSIFKIVELDLWTYNYMEENKHRFTQEAIDGAREFLGKKDLIKLQKDEEDVEQSKAMNCRYNRSQSAKNWKELRYKQQTFPKINGPEPNWTSKL